MAVTGLSGAVAQQPDGAVRPTDEHILRAHPEQARVDHALHLADAPVDGAPVAAGGDGQIDDRQPVVGAAPAAHRPKIGQRSRHIRGGKRYDGDGEDPPGVEGLGDLGGVDQHEEPPGRPVDDTLTHQRAAAALHGQPGWRHDVGAVERHVDRPAHARQANAEVTGERTTGPGGGDADALQAARHALTERADARRGGAAGAKTDPVPVADQPRGGPAGGFPGLRTSVIMCAHTPTGYASEQTMTEIAPGIQMIDTRLGGRRGLTSAYLVAGESPALIDPGPETSAALLIAELHDRGIGPHDLAWIVLTHIHLDHCGGTGALAAAFPKARVVVHERGARHLAEPARLVAASHEVYGPTAPLHGGLTATAADRIDAATDGHVVELGGDRRLEMIATPGHARHHMSVLDAPTGTLVIGDAAGTQLRDAGLYPNVPPSDVDIEAGRHSLARLGERAPTLITLSHFGPTADPAQTLEEADDALGRLGAAALEGYRAGGREGIAAAVDRRYPIAEAVGNPDALALWQWLSWDVNNILGLEIWAERNATDAPAG